jgi:hypothetical protein
MRISLSTPALFFLVVACGPTGPGIDRPDAGSDPSNPEGPTTPPLPPTYPPPPAQSCTQMDIVFVIDDSGSMAEEQSNLAQNFPRFAEVLENHRTESGQLLDYRVAITTTGRDVRYRVPFSSTPIQERGDNGAFRTRCGMTRPWIERGDGNLASAFPCAAQVGTEGPSYEMPLLMTEWALKERVADGTQAGFLRDDALLAVVMLTDEDDCSRADNDFTVPLFGSACADSDLIPVASFVSMLDQLKGERGRWATAVIAGPHDCTSSLGQAVEARRLKEFVAQTCQNAVFSSICEGDLATALADAIATFDQACDLFPPID